MKKIVSCIITIALFTALSAQVMAAETWREAFITRIMKIMSSDPTYSEVILTDLDMNGVPEAFILKNSSDGGISTGFTMISNTITTINVPSNIIGACLGDLTVYNSNGRYIFVGKEVPRYSSVVSYYEIVFDGTTVTATKTEKDKYSMLPTVPYSDMYGKDFLTSGYPNRTKIKDFIDRYDAVNTLTASKSTANVMVNGKNVEVSAYDVNDNNYFKIRDVAMLLRTTNARFDVIWDERLDAISISRGAKYTIVGGELAEDNALTLDIEENSAPIYIDGVETSLVAYNINGSNYFKIRDLGDAIGFRVDWHSDTQTILINTNE